MVHCGCAAATVLVACLSGATAMPDNDGRPYWKELMSAESPAPALHTLPDRQLNKQRSLATGAERARAGQVQGERSRAPAALDTRRRPRAPRDEDERRP